MKKPDRFDKLANKLKERIYVWARQGVPFDDVIASTIRREVRKAEKRNRDEYNRGYDDGLERRGRNPR